VDAPQPKFSQENQSVSGGPVLSRKIFRFVLTPNHPHNPRIPRPQRGAARDRHERWVWDAVDAAAREANVPAADGEIAWFWRPDAGAKLAKAMSAPWA
jgi:hypothetical protein